MENAKLKTGKMILENRYKQARYDLLIIFVFTLLNILVVTLDGSYYMLFSAYLPYTIAICGMVFCGRYPDEFYTGEFAEMNFIESKYFAIFIVVAVVLTSLYLLAFFLSKKERVGWLIFSLVFIILDTVLIFFIFSADLIFDLFIRAFMIFGITRGIVSHFQLKKLKLNENIDADSPFDLTTTNENNDYDSAYNNIQESQNNYIADSPILRKADFNVKYRVFLEYEIYGHKIIYRRVKKTNELVIDDNVYSEYIARMEFWHTLKANVDGHSFEAGIIQMTARCYIAVDGNIVKEKIRLI